MSDARARAVQGLQVGDSFTTTRTFTEEEVALFTTLSRDYNPIHFDERFAQARGFSAPICHGMLSASLLTEIGGQIGWLASSMNFRFKRPVYVGDKLVCRWEIKEIDARGRAKALVTITNSEEDIVIEAEVGGVVPGAEERGIMSKMIVEGDPTNGPNHTRIHQIADHNAQD